jgi:hypothetical protein
MKTRVFLLVFAISIFSTACGSGLPGAAKELAVGALCDFPVNSGQNMCRSVEVNEVVMIKISEDNSNENAKIWCIELDFVDYTGESGFACLWLIGPDEGGDFHLTKGPLFSEKCSGLD